MSGTAANAVTGLFNLSRLILKSVFNTIQDIRPPSPLSRPISNLHEPRAGSHTIFAQDSVAASGSASTFFLATWWATRAHRKEALDVLDDRRRGRRRRRDKGERIPSGPRGTPASGRRSPPTPSSDTCTCPSRRRRVTSAEDTGSATTFFHRPVCLDARTGRRVWHYQLVLHDIWDCDIPTPPILANVEFDVRSARWFS